MLFPEEEIIAGILKKKALAEARGEVYVADFNDALRLALYAHEGDTLHNGDSYLIHVLTVAFSGTLKHFDVRLIIAVLHDALENSGLTLTNLEECGFDKRVVQGVDGLTKRPGEKYFERIVRGGLAGIDTVVVKPFDIKHNSDFTREKRFISQDQIDKQDKYNIAYHYSHGVELCLEPGLDGEDWHGVKAVEPGTAMARFLSSYPAYASKPERCNELLKLFSSEEGEISVSENVSTFTMASNDLYSSAKRALPGDYLGRLQRCGRSGLKAINKELAQIEEDSQLLGSMGFMEQNHVDRLDVQNLAYHYLVDIKITKEAASRGDGGIEKSLYPGASMIDFIRMHDVYASNQQRCNELLSSFSSETRRFEVLGHPQHQSPSSSLNYVQG